MADKNLEIGLRIKADAKQAATEMENFKSELDDIDQSASTASTATDSLANDVENTGKKFVYAGQSVFSLRDALQQSETSAKQFTNTSADATTETERLAQKFVFAGKSTFSLRDGLNTVTLSSKDQAEELARLLSVYDGTSAYTQRLARDEAMLKKAMDEGRISADQYQRSIVTLQRRNQQLSSSYASLRGQMSNIGYQLQDIAVQAQMGVNPMTILSQQGSQLVSGFNPLAGAVIAVGGALAGALIPSLFNAGEEAESLTEKIKDLNKNYKTLTDAQRTVLGNEQRDLQKSLNEKKAQTQKEIEQLERRIAELQKIASNPDYFSGATGVYLSKPSDEQLDKLNEKNTRSLETARGELDTKTQELAETEKELSRIRGETVVDEQELLKETAELIESLEKETAAYGLVGAALGEYVATQLKADQIDATGKTRARIVELYRLREEQKKATEAEREAEAERDRIASKEKSRREANLEYVRNLERQAAALGMTAEQASNAEFAYRGLTGELLKQAQAAQNVIQADKDRLALAELNIQLLRAQGREQEVTQAEFEKRYGDMLKRLEAAGDTAGVEIIKQIIDLQSLDNTLAEVEKRFQKSLEDITRQENSINTQREAGLISEYEARRQIYELHRSQAAELEKIKPLLNQLKDAPGDVGESARTAIAALDDEILRLQSTMTLLQATLRDGLESGLTDAILGLADGTMTLRDAINALGQSVAKAIARMAAEALAQEAIAALFNIGSKDGDSMLAGAKATTTAAGALALAAAQWQVTAAQIQAAAVQLAASGGAGNSSGSSSSDNWATTLFSAAASYYAADGGHITGPGTSTSDSIPAMLSDNEYVTRAAVVSQPGALAFLHDFNSRGMAALQDWARVRHNTGGLAGVPAPAMPSPTLGSPLVSPAVDPGAGSSMTNRIMNVVDPALIEDYLNGPNGDNVFINMVKRNTAVVQRIAGTRK